MFTSFRRSVELARHYPDLYFVGLLTDDDIRSGVGAVAYAIAGGAILLASTLSQPKYNWDVPVLIMGVLFLVRAISWIFIDPNKRVFE